MHVVIHPASVDRCPNEVRMTQDVLQEIRIGAQAFDTKLRQRPPRLGAGCGKVICISRNNDLG